jgi:hypothetical protein
MKVKSCPKYAIVKKGDMGIPHMPSTEALAFIGKSSIGRKYPFPDPKLKDGDIVEAGEWVFIKQYKWVDTDWRDSGGEVTNPDEYDPVELGEKSRVVYRLIG